MLQPEPDSCVRNKRPYKEKKVSRTFTVFTCVWNFASSVNSFMVDFIAIYGDESDPMSCDFGNES